MAELLDKWLEVLDVEETTRRAYRHYLENAPRPVLGHVQVARLDAETIEPRYAVLRRCRLRCTGKRCTGSGSRRGRARG